MWIPKAPAPRAQSGHCQPSLSQLWRRIRICSLKFRQSTICPLIHASLAIASAGHTASALSSPYRRPTRGAKRLSSAKHAHARVGVIGVPVAADDAPVVHLHAAHPAFTQYPRSAANRNFQFTSDGGGKGRMTSALTWPACRRACSGTTPRRCDRPAPGTGSPRPPAQGEWVGIEGRGLGLGRAVAPPAAAAGRAGQRIIPGSTCANIRVPRAARSQQLNNNSLDTSPHTRRRRLLAGHTRAKEEEWRGQSADL